MTRLLITGTGRCGTHWLADCLNLAGVPTTHEYAFGQKQDGIRRRWTCEAAWPAAAYLPVADAKVVHLIRNPLDTIASRVARGTFSDDPPSEDQKRLGKWAAGQCPLIASGTSELERAALHWVGWNAMIEPHASATYQVEEVTLEVVNMLAWEVDMAAFGVGALPPPSHTSEHSGLSWDDLAGSVRASVMWRVTDMAERYGYR